MTSGFLKSILFRAAVLKLVLGCWLIVGIRLHSNAATVSVAELFKQGTNTYLKGDFDQAAMFFRTATTISSAAGIWHNLGNAEWQAGHPGPAILAWERGQWLDPFAPNTRENLRFARKERQLDTPELTWYEVCSTWLPANVWPAITMGSFWLALAMLTLPGVFRWRKAEWHQGLAAVGFAIFLLTLPALAGVQTRSQLGVILPEGTPLRLTPTHEAQVLTKLVPGEVARWERRHGNYVFIRSGSAAGWVENSQFALISSNQ